MQELKLQTLSVRIQPLVPPAIQHWPRLASLGSCSSSGPWKYLLLVVLSFHFISFLLTPNIDIFEGKGTFKCMNYRLMLSRIPQFLSQILSLALVYGSKICTTLCFLITHSLPNSLQSVVNSQHFIETTVRRVTDGLCTVQSNMFFSIFNLCSGGYLPISCSKLLLLMLFPYFIEVVILVKVYACQIWTNRCRPPLVFIQNPCFIT